MAEKAATLTGSLIARKGDAKPAVVVPPSPQIITAVESTPDTQELPQDPRDTAKIEMVTPTPSRVKTVGKGTSRSPRPSKRIPRQPDDVPMTVILDRPRYLRVKQLALVLDKTAQQMFVEAIEDYMTKAEKQTHFVPMGSTSTP